jgi:hypothetical protein
MEESVYAAHMQANLQQLPHHPYLPHAVILLQHHNSQGFSSVCDHHHFVEPYTLQDTALNYSGSSLWGNWLEMLEAAMAKLLVKAVPAQHFAQQLVATALQPRMPRYWVGPCAGVEWLLRFFPLWLQVGNV